MRGLVFVVLSSLYLYGETLLPSCESLSVKAEKIYGASPPVNYMLYSVDPGLMSGLNFPLWEHEGAFMREVKELPVLGGWFGQGRTPNMEMVAAVKPDLVMVWNYRASYERIVASLKQLDIPACYMELNTLDDYPKTYRIIGKISGQTARTEKLAEDFETRLKHLRTVAQRHRDQALRVYYAEGVDGLRTECHVSVHAELIEESGAYNVHRCEQRSAYGMEQITPETLIRYDPQVIIVHRPDFFAGIYDDPRFKSLSAVRNKRVYLIPRIPVNWFDRPPSFMRVLGLEWLMGVLYPEEKIDMLSSMKAFFKLHFDRVLEEREAAAILGGGTLKGAKQ